LSLQGRKWRSNLLYDFAFSGDWFGSPAMT
jgi:hypothetical protein